MNISYINVKGQTYDIADKLARQSSRPIVVIDDTQVEFDQDIIYLVSDAYINADRVLYDGQEYQFENYIANIPGLPDESKVQLVFDSECADRSVSYETDGMVITATVTALGRIKKYTLVFSEIDEGTIPLIFCVPSDGKDVQVRCVNTYNSACPFEYVIVNNYTFGRFTTPIEQYTAAVSRNDKSYTLHAGQAMFIRGSITQNMTEMFTLTNRFEFTGGYVYIDGFLKNACVNAGCLFMNQDRILKISQSLFKDFGGDLYSVFKNCTGLQNASGYAAGEFAFAGCTSLTDIPQNARGTWNMFYGCTSLERADLVTVDTSYKADAMFASCPKLKYAKIYFENLSDELSQIKIVDSGSGVLYVNGSETLVSVPSGWEVKKYTE